MSPRRKHHPPKFHKKQHDGEIRTKTVTIRVIPPPPFKPQVHRIKAHPGYNYQMTHVDDLLSIVSDRVEQQFSKWEFRLVELGPDRYNFVYVGEKKPNLLHAGKQAAKILEEINDGSKTSSDAAAVPVSQDRPSVEDRSDRGNSGGEGVPDPGDGGNPASGS